MLVMNEETINPVQSSIQTRWRNEEEPRDRILKKNNTDRLSFVQIIICTNVIIVLLAGSIPACICASRRRIIVRDFPFPFSHFAIVVDDCVHSYWLEGLVLLQRNCCSAVNLKKWRMLLHNLEPRVIWVSCQRYSCKEIFTLSCIIHLTEYQ